MNQETPSWTDIRQLASDLQRLAESPAPGTLRPAVLTAVGIADGYWAVDSPIGPLFVATNRHGISMVMPAEDGETFERAFRQRFGRQVFPLDTPPTAIAGTVKRLLDGQRTPLPPVDLRGLSDFQQAVLLNLPKIPRGEVRPYSWLAHEIGHPKAQRAVGSALNHNPVPLILPCHRVVRSNGDLGGYAFGPEVKRTLLTTEGALTGDPAEYATPYVGSDTTHIYCYPTCRHARRVTPQHKVRFHTPVQAEGAGYRPCKVCRPV